jgi:hypothetical protein
MGQGRRPGATRTSVEGRDGAQGPEREPPAPDADLYSRAERGPRLHVGPLGPRVVPAAQVAPDLGVLRYVRADAGRWGADQVTEQPLRLECQPGRGVPGPVREGQHTDAVVGCQEDLRVEPGSTPWCSTTACPPRSTRKNPRKRVDQGRLERERGVPQMRDHRRLAPLIMRISSAQCGAHRNRGLHLHSRPWVAATHARARRSFVHLGKGSGQLLSCLLKVWKNTSEASRTTLACAVASVVAHSTPVVFAASSSRSSRFFSTFS